MGCHSLPSQSRALVVLGAPLGSPALVAAQLQRLSASHAGLLQRIRGLEKLQASWLLLLLTRPLGATICFGCSSLASPRILLLLWTVFRICCTSPPRSVRLCWVVAEPRFPSRASGRSGLPRGGKHQEGVPPRAHAGAQVDRFFIGSKNSRGGWPS